MSGWRYVCIFVYILWRGPIHICGFKKGGFLSFPAEKNPQAGETRIHETASAGELHMHSGMG